LWQFVAVKPTKTNEVRARVEPIIKIAVEKQAQSERLAPPDIIRKALWDYLVKTKSPFIAHERLEGF
jgi:ribosomal protein L17